MSVPNTFLKNSYFYYVRRVPKRLRHHYKSNCVSFSLRTKKSSIAVRRSAITTDKLDNFWFQLDVGNSIEHIGLIANSGLSHHSKVPTLSSMLDYYLEHKGKNRSSNFFQSAKLACSYLYKVAGDKSIGEYKREDALAMRDYLFSKNLAGASVRRLVGSIRAIINFAVAEHCLDINNPFNNVFIDIKVRQTRRQPIPLPVFRTIQDECMSIGDEYRLLILLMSGSLMRLSEAAGLMAGDIKVVDGIMTASIAPNQIRDLKTAASQRTIPLVGVARVGVERLLARSSGLYLFPKLVAGGYNRNSVSAAVNRWL